MVRRRQECPELCACNIRVYNVDDDDDDDHGHDDDDDVDVLMI